MEAPGRMPGPRGAGILPAACNSQVSREANTLLGTAGPVAISIKNLRESLRDLSDSAFR